MSASPLTGRLAGKVALVTGASRGIGAAIAERLARDGAAVVVNYVSDSSAAQRVVDAIIGSGGTAVAIQTDVGQVKQARELVAETLRRFGRLDILVNNAAVANRGPLAEIEEADFDRLFTINVRAPLFLVQAALEALTEARGAVINISSAATRTVSASMHVYTATKAAIDMLTQTLARELGPHGIRVNAVAPGTTETDMLAKVTSAAGREAAVERIALRRLGRPNDIAEVVAFLASDAGYWITGEILHANGGQRL